MFKLMVLGVAVILISLIVIAVGCLNQDTPPPKVVPIPVPTTADAPPQVQVTAPVQAQVFSFGGPYAYQGGIQKIAEFQWYKDHLKDLSEQMLLTQNRLSRSIKANLVGDGTGIELQRYNYVVPDGESQIYVGVWKENITWATEAAWIHAGIVHNRDETCTNSTPDSSAPPKATMGAMIDFYSEEPEINFRAGITPPLQASPCWLQVAKEGKKVGILDSMTKHFMLVQKDKTLQDFDLAALASWPSKEVAYAGELFVLISNGECRVVINNGSGTYKPDAGNDRGSLKHLKAVADFFPIRNLQFQSMP